MNYDGSGRMTADEIARAYGERILAGGSQLMERAGRDHEVFPSFLTRRFYGHYNWQTASYEVRTRHGDRPVTRRLAARPR